MLIKFLQFYTLFFSIGIDPFPNAKIQFVMQALQEEIEQLLLV